VGLSSSTGTGVGLGGDGRAEPAGAETGRETLSLVMGSFFHGKTAPSFQRFHPLIARACGPPSPEVAALSLLLSFTDPLSISGAQV
jgi:hypothetical protein